MDIKLLVAFPVQRLIHVSEWQTGGFLAFKWEVKSSSTTLINRFLYFFTEIATIEMSISIHWICSPASPQVTDVPSLFFVKWQSQLFFHMFYIYKLYTEFKWISCTVWSFKTFISKPPIFFRGNILGNIFSLIYNFRQIEIKHFSLANTFLYFFFPCNAVREILQEIIL